MVDAYYPMFVYMGDTHINVFKAYPHLFTYSTIVVECTFIGDEAEVRERADRDGHIHWFVLCLLSLRLNTGTIWNPMCLLIHTSNLF
jgi:hypothetical protein